MIPLFFSEPFLRQCSVFKSMKHFFIICVLATLVTLIPNRAIAVETTFFRGTVDSISSDSASMLIIIDDKDGVENKITIPTFADKSLSSTKYSVGDKLIISSQTVNDKIFYAVSDRDRTIPYIGLIALFIALVVIIGRVQGFISIGAMIVSFSLITQFTIPQIVEGVDPIVVSMITALVIIPLTFYLSHGFNKKTSLAVISTMIALLLTAVLSVAFTRFGHLTGLSSDEADAVIFKLGSNIRLADLLIAGMIISAMGVLDDVTISQIGIVQALNKVRPDMKNHHLFTEAMEQGRDHIASLVNTLILVYAGAALPLFLLVYKSETPLWVVIQRESIAEEITRTFVSSIGIIAAVPIATMIAVKWGKRRIGHLQKEKLF